MAAAPTTSSPPAKIGILGTGNMGRALGLRYAQLHHPVLFAGRSPTEAPQRAAQRANSLTSSTGSSSATTATHGSLDAAASGSDVLIWTMRTRDASAVLGAAGIAALSGKLVLDLNNRDYAEDVMGGGGKEGGKWFEQSLGEQLQANLPGALVLKAFNTVAMEALDTSAEKLRRAGAQVFVAGVEAPKGMGTKERAKLRVLAVQLIEELGFEVVDLGDGATAMRVAEALGDAVRYIMIDNKKGGRTNIGVRVLPEPDLGTVGEREESSYH